MSLMCLTVLGSGCYGRAGSRKAEFLVRTAMVVEGALNLEHSTRREPLPM